MAHDVFVSYSSLDKPTADAVCAVLEKCGYRCWIAPRDILPGQSWGASIMEAINGAKVMVLVFSRNANASPQVEREVERAVNRRIPLIPLRIENAPPSKSFEYFISAPHWLDAFSLPLEEHLDYLARVVGQILTSRLTDQVINPLPVAAEHDVAEDLAPGGNQPDTVASLEVAAYGDDISNRYRVVADVAVAEIQTRPTTSSTAGTRTPLLEVKGLKKHFPIHGGLLGLETAKVYAVDGVSFDIARGETLSLVGESGCGKSTVGKAILRLYHVTDGAVYLDGQRIDNMPAAQLRPIRQRVQVVFQDPFSSLNPRMKIIDIVGEPLMNFGLADGRTDLREKVAALMDKVRLPRDAIDRYPHEFSGGQRQRIGIARALAPGADLIICDEAVSALDVSVKAQIINLLVDLQDELGLALLFISHDLATVEHLTHRVAVMYLGKIVELTDRRTLFSRPHHPYTAALLSAVPVPDPTAPRNRVILTGDVPSPISPPAGCRFHTRCPLAFDRCRTEEPVLRRVGDRHESACHLEHAPGELVMD